jgi:hypothetical protein
MASSIAMLGDPAEVTLGSQRPMVAPVPKVLIAGGATHSVANAGVVGDAP